MAKSNAKKNENDSLNTKLNQFDQSKLYPIYGIHISKWYKQQQQQQPASSTYCYLPSPAPNPLLLIQAFFAINLPCSTFSTHSLILSESKRVRTRKKEIEREHVCVSADIRHREREMRACARARVRLCGKRKNMKIKFAVFIHRMLFALAMYIYGIR